MENMELYNRFRKVPDEAKKPITAGRLKGKTDINPMWRMKMLTEAFGPCGFGWTLKIVRTWIEESETARYTDETTRHSEKTANVEIELRVNVEGKWSEPIPGIGGAMFVEMESKGVHVDDECYKKAFTDAISVACKSLGIAADVYFDRDPDSKYPTQPQKFDPTPVQHTIPVMTYEMALHYVMPGGKYQGKTMAEIFKTDIAYINELGASPDTGAEILTAINLICAEIKKAREAKQGV